ncbi:MAG: TIGR04283 family arsenosugar biosynthesis glycosyltransferase [Elusimicrobiota bacterium]
MKVSVIIPTWNEGRQIGAALRRLRGISSGVGTEVIVVDGGSKDETVAAAREWADKVLPLGGTNRGAQLRKGAQEARGDLLFFLHPDTQPPGDWRSHLERFWRSSGAKTASATVFSVDYGKRWSFRIFAWGRNLRMGLRQTAYGEAGICTTREIYERSGGIPEIPLMEDVVFSRRLKRLGRIVRLPGRIRPAARRLHKAGPARNALREFWIRTRFALGDSPESLWRRYYSVKMQDAPGLADGERILKRAVRGN